MATATQKTEVYRMVVKTEDEAFTVNAHIRGLLGIANGRSKQTWVEVMATHYLIKDGADLEQLAKLILNYQSMLAGKSRGFDVVVYWS